MWNYVIRFWHWLPKKQTCDLCVSDENPVHVEYCTEAGIFFCYNCYIKTYKPEDTSDLNKLLQKAIDDQS